MAAILTLYSAAAQYGLDGTINYNADALTIALVSSAYTPAQTTHAVLADVFTIGNPPEITAGFGYTAGGVLAGVGTITRSGATTTFSLANFALGASGGAIGAWRYAILYAAKSANARTNPLVAYLLGDNTAGGTDIPSCPNGAFIRINWNPSGVYTAS